MEIVYINDLVEYNKFINDLYKLDPFFKNNKRGLINMVCNRDGEFYSNTIQKMIAVKDMGSKMCQCVLINHKSYKDTLVVSFFEAIKDSFLAVEYMMDYVFEYAKENGCKKIEISLDGHCNYSVGFLKSDEHEFPTFGASYNPYYYHDFFEEKYKKIEFVSFCDSIDVISSNIEKTLPIIKNEKERFVLECADFSAVGFNKTMKRYTDLNNEIFINHKYYYHRTYEEDLELFGEMKLLLKSENIIFAVKQGVDVGFILWYPDFNEFVAPNKQAGILTFLKSKLLKNHINKIKVVEIGVVSQCQSSGVILMLFADAISKVKSSYPNTKIIISSWILEENKKSKKIANRFMKNIYKRFVAYEREI